ncbi:hypothetical protein [Deinococcus rubellus]|uniref:hypothetical protein n=1 Tax=Deinococcus rubellus TaxID=1889240 RepID=UPI0031F147CD
MPAPNRAQHFDPQNALSADFQRVARINGAPWATSTTVLLTQRSPVQQKLSTGCHSAQPGKLWQAERGWLTSPTRQD